MTLLADEFRMKAEKKLRKQLDKMRKILDDFHCGNLQALLRAQDHARREIIGAVQRNEISPEIAEGLKVKVDNWD